MTEGIDARRLSSLGNCSLSGNVDGEPYSASQHEI
jgi:hypothetical protein